MNLKFQFLKPIFTIVERISCHFWPNCALPDKSTKIGTEVVWYVIS